MNFWWKLWKKALGLSFEPGNRRSMVVHLNGRTRLYKDPGTAQKDYKRRQRLNVIPVVVSLVMAYFAPDSMENPDTFAVAVDGMVAILSCAGTAWTAKSLLIDRKKQETGDYTDLPLLIRS